jgi:hypothetical protein
MTLFIDPHHIVWDEFHGLEKAEPQWLDQIDYWEQYTAAFFRSNGLTYRPEDSNVHNWLQSSDRAPFASMADALLSRLADQTDLSAIDFILLAHWLPDLHLGTSVTNFAMHRLGLNDCFGFAISDHGLSAPFFALDCMHRYLRNGRRRGLLMMMDQKHLLYRSDIVDRMQPANSACIVSVDIDEDHGLAYAGYRRRNTSDCSVGSAIAGIIDEFGLRHERLALIADQDLLDQCASPAAQVATDPRLLCSAPFAALQRIAKPGGDYLLLTHGEGYLSAIAFRFDGDAS